MKEQIELELNKIRDRWETDDGILDSEYSRLENMIFAEKSNESFSTIMHLLFILKKKVAMENDWQYEQWRTHVTDFVYDKMGDLFSFIENEISADEFSTLSEIWDDVAKKKLRASSSFLSCIRLFRNFQKKAKNITLKNSLMMRSVKSLIGQKKMTRC